MLVEVFGAASDATLALARALVADPLVGLRASAALNDQAEEIENVGEPDTERIVDSSVSG